MSEFFRLIIEFAVAFSPLVAVRYFQFLNPKIIEDFSGAAVIAMLVTGLVTHFLSRPTASNANPPSKKLGGLMAVACLVCLFSLIALSRGAFSQYPELIAVLAPCCFVGTFAGLSGTIAWAAAFVR